MFFWVYSVPAFKLSLSLILGEVETTFSNTSSFILSLDPYELVSKIFGLTYGVVGLSVSVLNPVL